MSFTLSDAQQIVISNVAATIAGLLAESGQSVQMAGLVGLAVGTSTIIVFYIQKLPDNLNQYEVTATVGSTVVSDVASATCAAKFAKIALSAIFSWSRFLKYEK